MDNKVELESFLSCVSLVLVQNDFNNIKSKKKFFKITFSDYK